MREQYGRKQLIFRWGIRVFFAFFLAFLVEMAFNYPSFMQGYGYEDLSPQFVSDNGHLSISRVFGEPRYVKKLLLDGTFEKNPYYTVRLAILNGFGAEEIIELETGQILFLNRHLPI